jgi:hypothetical protein
MGNDCWCTLLLLADEATIQVLRKISSWYPASADEYFTESFNIIQEGTSGLRIGMLTKWEPDYAHYNKLMAMYPDLWLKCTWSEEGGMAGVFVAYREEGEIKTKSLMWQEMCIEEEMARFGHGIDRT